MNAFRAILAKLFGLEMKNILEILMSFCKSSSSLLADIVLFGLSLSDFPSMFLKTSARERFPHSYKNVLFSSPTDLGFHTAHSCEIPHRLRRRTEHSYKGLETSF